MVGSNKKSPYLKELYKDKYDINQKTKYLENSKDLAKKINNFLHEFQNNFEDVHK